MAVFQILINNCLSYLVCISLNLFGWLLFSILLYNMLSVKLSTLKFPPVRLIHTHTHTPAETSILVDSRSSRHVRFRVHEHSGISSRFVRARHMLLWKQKDEILWGHIVLNDASFQGVNKMMVVMESRSNCNWDGEDPGLSIVAHFWYRHNYSVDSLTFCELLWWELGSVTRTICEGTLENDS